MKYLLDTHMLLWWVNGTKRVGAKIQKIFENVSPERPFYLSDISLWEIAMLVELGRIKLDRPVRDWLEAATAPPLLICHRITAAVAERVAALPDSFHRDPADRIIIATAQLLGATLVTADSDIKKARLVETVN